MDNLFLLFPSSATEGDVEQIPLEEIPYKREQLVTRLVDLKAEANLWLDLARGCLRAGSLPDATAVLQSFSNTLANKDIDDCSEDDDVSIALSLLTDLQLQSLFQADANIDRRAQLLLMHQRIDAEAKDTLLPLLHQGLLYLMKGETDEAEKAMTSAAKKQHRGKKSLLPILALGILSFKSRNYTKAIAYFRHVLKRLGSKACPTDVRVAIGFCLLSLGRIDYAIQIFKRCSPHLGAIYGQLSALMKKYATQSNHRREAFAKMIAMVENVTQASMKEGKSFEPVLFVFLARIALVQGEYDTAAKLSKCAMHRGRSDAIVTQASLIHARSRHAMGEFLEAMKHYSHVLQLKPDSALALYGMSQINTAEGNVRNAATSLEQIVTRFFNESSTQDLFTSTASQHIALDGSGRSAVTLEHVGEAVRLLQVLATQLQTSARDSHWLNLFQEHPKQTQQYHTVPETFIAVGEMLTGRDRMEAFKTALDLYKQNIERVSKHNAIVEELQSKWAPPSSSSSFNFPLLPVPRIPLRVHNNAAVAFYQVYKERGNDWQWCIQCASEHSKKALAAYNEEKPSLSKVTLLYNRARVLEENGYLTQAGSIYKDIIKTTPLYLEAHVQYIAICRKKRMMELAVAQGTESAKTFPQSTVIKCILSALCLEMGEYQRSKEFLYEVTKGGHPNDLLAIVLLGMLNYRMAPSDVRSSKQLQRAREHWIRALEYFMKALSLNKNCLHAALGASAVIGEFGRCVEIPKLYETIVDMTSRQRWASEIWLYSNPILLPSAEVNLGHLWFTRHEFTHASRLYRYAAELYKHKGKADMQLQVIIARTHYQSHKRFKEAAETLRRLMHQWPWDITVQFNLALVLQGAGVHFLAHFVPPSALRDDTPRKEIRSAINSIEQALGLYYSLLALPREVHRLDASALNEQIQLCNEFKQKGEETFEKVSDTLERQKMQDRHYHEQIEDQKRKEREAKRLAVEQQGGEIKRHHLRIPLTAGSKRPHQDHASMAYLAKKSVRGHQSFLPELDTHETKISALPINDVHEMGMLKPDLEDDVEMGEVERSVEVMTERRQTLFGDEEDDG